MSRGCTRDGVVIFGSVVWFSGTANLTASFKFTPDDPCCHSNEIWDKIGYNSACIGDIAEILVRTRGFEGRNLPCVQNKNTQLHCLLLFNVQIYTKIALNVSDKRRINTCISISVKHVNHDVLFVHRVSEKTSKIIFFHNYVKFPLNLTIFGRKMAKSPKLHKVHSFSTSHLI